MLYFFKLVLKQVHLFICFILKARPLMPKSKGLRKKRNTAEGTFDYSICDLNFKTYLMAEYGYYSSRQR